MKKETSTEYCKYVFTDDEKRQIAQDMAQAVTKKDELEGNKKAATKQFDSDISREEAAIKVSATRLQNGFEMRMVKCDLKYDYKAGTVSYIRQDTFEVAKVRKMTDDERQAEVDDPLPITAPVDES